MMTAFPPGSGILPSVFLRKNPLPAPKPKDGRRRNMGPLPKTSATLPYTRFDNSSFRFDGILSH